MGIAALMVLGTMCTNLSFWLSHAHGGGGGGGDAADTGGHRGAAAEYSVIGNDLWCNLLQYAVCQHLQPQTPVRQLA
eukprot:6207620-Pleurochrysis_carterae.AAC.2